MDDPMMFPKMLCKKCGRMAHVHPETGKPQKHHVGKEFKDKDGKKLSRKARKQTWCPEEAA